MASIRNIRGRVRYEEDLKILIRVSHGEMEGALPKFQTEAQRLIELHNQLNHNQIGDIKR